MRELSKDISVLCPACYNVEMSSGVALMIGQYVCGTSPLESIKTLAAGGVVSGLVKWSDRVLSSVTSNAAFMYGVQMEH